MRAKNWLSILGELVSEVRENIPFLTAEEQTRLSWLKLISRLEDVPEAFRESFEGITDLDNFPYTVLTPSYAGFLTKGSEKVVICLEDRIVELVVSGGEVTRHAYPMKDVLYLVDGKVLLQAWVKLVGLTEHGKTETTEFRFNTASEHLFTPIVKAIRTAAVGPQDSDILVEKARFDFLQRENYKLMNYGRRSILPGEKVRQVIHQPEIRSALFRLFGKTFFRKVCFSQLCTLTDRELIVIEEGEGTGKGEAVRYGGVFFYIPLEKITSMEVVEKNDGLIALVVRLAGGVDLEWDFLPENQEALEALASAG